MDYIYIYYTTASYFKFMGLRWGIFGWILPSKKAFVYHQVNKWGNFRVTSSTPSGMRSKTLTLAITRSSYVSFWSLRFWVTKSNILSPNGPSTPIYAYSAQTPNSQFHCKKKNNKTIQKNWQKVPWKQKKKRIFHCSVIVQLVNRTTISSLPISSLWKLYNKN